MPFLHMFWLLDRNSQGRTLYCTLLTTKARIHVICCYLFWQRLVSFLVYVFTEGKSLQRYTLEGFFFCSDSLLAFYNKSSLLQRISKCHQVLLLSVLMFALFLDSWDFPYFFPWDYTFDVFSSIFECLRTWTFSGFIAYSQREKSCVRHLNFNFFLSFREDKILRDLGSNSLLESVTVVLILGNHLHLESQFIN